MKKKKNRKKRKGSAVFETQRVGGSFVQKQRGKREK
jgi:hypothetical protein